MEMADNEKRLNELFLTIYDLHGEFTTDINRRDISSTSIFDSSDEIPEDIKESYYVKTRDVITELISYAVGCIMGRYSLDKPGLAFAGGAWDASQYASYIPDRDGILPITDDEYFDDDIVGMFVNWVRTVYGEKRWKPI